MVKIDTRKTLFTMSGLVAVVLIMLFARAYNVNAAAKTGEKFGDWTISCEKDDKNKQFCFLVQTVTSKDPQDEKKVQHIATFRIGHFNQSKELKMLQVLPFGVSLQSGTSIILGKEKLISPAKFTTCQTFGCVALADLGKKELDALIEAKEAFVGVISSDGKQINITLSTKGLKDGIAALK